MHDPPTPPARFTTLGVPVDAVQIPEVIEILISWIERNEGNRFVAVTGMHGLVEAQEDPAFKTVLRGADLVVPDGTPLVWIGRKKGHPLARRVYGPELLETFCRETGVAYSHFFFGGAPGVAEKLAQGLADRHQIRIAGIICPSFTNTTQEELEAVIEKINESDADVVWVGLSTPKQEKWMNRSRPLLQAPVSVGVGAAFDLLSGEKRSAPRWMMENGLEWLFRLGQEPRRLWRRYLIGGAKFARHLALERWGKRTY